MTKWFTAKLLFTEMYGDYDIKFPQARAFYMYMMVHPGKNLILWVMNWGSSGNGMKKGTGLYAS